jgi:ribosomal protein S17
MTEQTKRSIKNEKVGSVVSARMAKTIVVEVTRRVPHPLYKRIVSKRKKFYAHDEESSAKTGDIAVAYLLAGSGTKLRAHTGNGYRSPALFERFGESNIEQWSDATWEAFTLHLLWYACRSGVHGVRHCLPKPIKIPLTVSSLGLVNRAYPGYRTPGRLAPLLEWRTESDPPWAKDGEKDARVSRL